ncbi:neural Wiskott-Aldrich syndrome protein-like [Orussus abietinus]|uniref:neural Wiskott-Aldrich syndrome protein-like n=1 Tax=Orussus abietinus TaxID=222816 RepID=UPI000C715FFF|nr:neural Wiskott-Aldrich syndrome protein-like [Orussus abietinus]
MARREVELQRQGTQFMNEALREAFPHRSTDAIKGKRRAPAYRALVAQLAEEELGRPAAHPQPPPPPSPLPPPPAPPESPGPPHHVWHPRPGPPTSQSNPPPGPTTSRDGQQADPRPGPSTAANPPPGPWTRSQARRLADRGQPGRRPSPPTSSQQPAPTQPPDEDRRLVDALLEWVREDLPDHSAALDLQDICRDAVTTSKDTILLRLGLLLTRYFPGQPARMPRRPPQEREAATSRQRRRAAYARIQREAELPSLPDYPCEFPGWERVFTSATGRGVHHRRAHADWYDRRTVAAIQHHRAPWTEEEITIMATREAEFVMLQIRHLNMELH